MPTRLDGEAASRAGTRVLPLARGAAEFPLCRSAGARRCRRCCAASRRRSSCKGVPLDRLKFLAVHDTEPFARWEAGQQVATRTAARADRRPSAAASSAGAARPRPRRGDAAHPRRCRPRPGLRRRGADLAERGVSRRPDGGRRCRRHPCGPRNRPRRARRGAGGGVRRRLPRTSPMPARYRIDGASIGRRALRNVCLAYLAAADPEKGAALAMAQFDAGAQYDGCAGGADGAGRSRPARAGRGTRPVLRAVVAGRAGHRQMVRLQARSSLPDTPDRVRELTPASRPSTRKNPNRVRALVGAFAQANQLRFHDASGAGYAFLADEVHRARPDQPDDGRAPRPAARLLAPPRPGAPGADAARAANASSPPRASARTPTRWSPRASPSIQ